MNLWLLLAFLVRIRKKAKNLWVGGGGVSDGRGKVGGPPTQKDIK